MGWEQCLSKHGYYVRRGSSNTFSPGIRIVEKKKKIIPLSIHPPLLSLLHLRHKNEKRKAKIPSSEFSHGARARHFPTRNSDLKFSKACGVHLRKKGHSLEKCKGEGGGVLRLFLFFSLLKKRRLLFCALLADFPFFHR